MVEMDYIVCGDNLEVLKTMNTGIVDLVYIDPPFFTSRNYEIIFNDGAEIRAFEDRWVKEGEGRYTKDINVYLNYMQPRIQEIYRVLKPTGSFYLHCDYHADAYLRILCDQIFNREPQSIITWKRQSAHANSNTYGVIDDRLLFYTKSDNFTFIKQYEPYDQSYLDKHYTHKDERGVYRLDNTSAPNNANRYEWRGITKSWRYTKEKLEKLYQDGFIEISKKGTGASFKRYLETMQGNPLSTIWDNITCIQSKSKENMGYPTQKPEALMERIIQASSNEGFLVADFFCGCGGFLAVAKRLKRHFIGCDISPTACRLVAKRIGLNPKDIVDMPLTPEEVAELTGYEFQNYVIDLLEVGVDKRNVKVNNRGADGGIDGKYYDYFLQVKKYKAGRKDLDEFVATLYRNKQKKGIIIALEYSSDFTKEIARLGREDNLIILPLTLEQIIAREHLKIISVLDKEMI